MKTHYLINNEVKELVTVCVNIQCMRLISLFTSVAAQNWFYQNFTFI